MRGPRDRGTRDKGSAAADLGPAPAWWREGDTGIVGSRRRPAGYHRLWIGGGGEPEGCQWARPVLVNHGSERRATFRGNRSSGSASAIMHSSKPPTVPTS